MLFASFKVMGPSAAVSVRCLGCGSLYVKPLGEGTAADNPGCPKCGYVGWTLVRREVSEVTELRRFAAGPLPPRPW
jgi:hypothetical protein